MTEVITPLVKVQSFVGYFGNPDGSIVPTGGSFECLLSAGAADAQTYIGNFVIKLGLFLPAGIVLAGGRNSACHLRPVDGTEKDVTADPLAQCTQAPQQGPDGMWNLGERAVPNFGVFLFRVRLERTAAFKGGSIVGSARTIYGDLRSRVVVAPSPAQLAPLPTAGRIGFVSNPGPDAAICWITPDGKTRGTLLNEPLGGVPVYSPDARQIAFLSMRDGRPQIYTMNADGAGNQTRLTALPPLNAMGCGKPTWSLDGTVMVVPAAGVGVDWELFEVKLADGTQLLLTDARQGSAQGAVKLPDGSSAYLFTRWKANTLPRVREQLLIFAPKNASDPNVDVPPTAMFVFANDNYMRTQLTWHKRGLFAYTVLEKGKGVDESQIAILDGLNERIDPDFRGSCPTFSPDGEWIAYVKGRRLANGYRSTRITIRELEGQRREYDISSADPVWDDQIDWSNA